MRRTLRHARQPRSKAFNRNSRTLLRASRLGKYLLVEALEDRSMLSSLTTVGEPIVVKSWSNPPPPLTGGVQAAIDAAGNFAVIYASATPPSSTSDIRLYDESGVPRTNGVDIGVPGDFEAAVHRKILMDDSGNYTLFSPNFSPETEPRISFRQFSSDGTPRSTVIEVGYLVLPFAWSCAMDASGNFVIAWSEFVPAEFLPKGYYSPTGRVLAQRYDAMGTARGSPIQVNTVITALTECHGVSMNSSGDFVVCWTAAKSYSTGLGIDARVFAADGTPHADPIRVASDSPVYDIDIALGEDRGFVVSWTDFNTIDNVGGEAQDLEKLQQYNSAMAAVGPPITLGTLNPIQIEAVSDSNYVVIQSNSARVPGAPPPIPTARVLSADGTLTAPIPIFAETLTVWGANASANANGDIVVIGSSFISPHNIYAQRLKLRPPLDLKATSLTYKEGATAAQDYLHATYSAQGASTSDAFQVQLVWSRTAEWSDRLGVAKTISSEELDLAKHSFDIPLSSLTARPNNANYLLLFFDPPSNTKPNGDVEETVEGTNAAPGNNLTSLNIEPEINPTDSRWNYTEGGLDVDYELENRFFINKPIMVDMRWRGVEGSVPATRPAGVAFKVKRDKKDHHIEWRTFITPTIGDRALELAFDPKGDIKEQNDDNNTVSEAVGDWRPEIIITGDPKQGLVGLRKIPYDMAFTLKNKAPIEIDVELYWEEIIAPEVFEKLPLNRGVRSAPITKRMSFGDADGVEFVASTLDGKGKFVRSWNWIPPENFEEQAEKLSVGIQQDVLLEMAQQAAEGLQKARQLTKGSIAAFDTFNDFKDLIEAFADPEPILREVNIEFVVGAKALVDSQGLDRNASDMMKLLVPEDRKSDLRKFQDAAGTASVLNNLAVGLFIETAGASSALLPAGVAAWHEARALYRKALDPPNPSYREIVALEVNDGDLQSQPMEAALREYARQRLLRTALTDAAAATEDCVLGAREAADAFWEARQLEALSAFQHRLAVEGVRQVGQGSLMQGWFASVFGTLPSDPEFTFPEDLRAKLVAMGASEEDLLLITRNAADRNLGSPAGAELLVWLDAQQAALNALDAIRSLKDAVSVRTNSLGDSILTVSDTMLREIAARQAEIEAGFADPLPSAHQRQLVEVYLADVRALVLATNNFDGLQEALKFGYGALIELQFDVPSVTRLQEFVADQETDGRISADVANLLESVLIVTQQNLENGQFQQASDAFNDLLGILNDRHDDGIDSRTADELSGFVRYLESFDDLPADVTLSIEGNLLAETTGTATVTATLSTVSDGPVTVNLAFRGTARNTVDYTPSASAITIPAGATTGSVTLSVLPDFLDEPDETIVVEIEARAEADQLGQQQVTSTIVDDDMAHLFVVTPDAGNKPTNATAWPLVRVYEGETGVIKLEINPYPNFTGGVRVASGDINGDGTPEIITAPGRGGGPQVKVFDGVTGQRLLSFLAFENTFTKGIQVAAADVNGDGRAEIIVGTDGERTSTSSRVRIFDGTTGAQLANFDFNSTSGFQTGVSVAAGDVDGDGRSDLIVGSAAGVEPRVAILDVNSGARVATFLVNTAAFTGGVHLATGDLNGDGIAEIITSSGRGGGPQVKVFSGQPHNRGARVAQIVAYDPSFKGGVRVGATDYNFDGRADIVTGAGPGGGSHVRVFSGADLSRLFQTFAYKSAGADFFGGLFVSGSFRAVGEPLHALGTRMTEAFAASITTDDATAAMRRAIADWEAVGLGDRWLELLSSTQVRVADLPGDLLGLASANGVVLDANAAGHGWFVDLTPAQDEEFELIDGVLRARAGSAAADRIDLLSAVAHELGHLLELDDIENGDWNDDVMSGLLPAGVRRRLAPENVDAVFSVSETP